VKTFSVGFREDGDTNELADARFVAQLFGADHHELELSADDDDVDLSGLIWHLDEPVADLSALGFLALSRLASEHVTVALAGQGADELLGGYLKHRAAALASTWQKLPRRLRRTAHPVLQRGRGRFRRAGMTLAAGQPADLMLALSGQLTPAIARRLLKPEVSAVSEAWTRTSLDRLAEGCDYDPLPLTLHMDAQLALPDDMLHYFDRTSMAHSLEVRVPFLDQEVVELCARIPASLKVHGLTTKHVLREAARGIVPDRIVDKRKIGFFRGAAQGWLRSQLDRAVADHLLAPAPAYSEFLEPAAVRDLVGEAQRTRRRVQLVLAILMLEVWLSTFLPRAVRSTAPERERISLRT
jgi:asparagine synthase (glutamine-hydrolysing)